jgi:hypothetical protein
VQLVEREAALVLGHREAERELERQRQRDGPVEQDGDGAVAGLGGRWINGTQFRPPR